MLANTLRLRHVGSQKFVVIGTHSTKGDITSCELARDKAAKLLQLCFKSLAKSNARVFRRFFQVQGCSRCDGKGVGMFVKTTGDLNDGVGHGRFGRCFRCQGTRIAKA